MAHADAALSVGEISAMCDADLAEFMLAHRGDDGNFNLPIKGLEKLSEDQRSALAQRLQVQTSLRAQSPSTCTRPLDINDLDARLRRISPTRSPSPREDSVSRSASSTPPLDTKAQAMYNETNAYEKLVSEGGRPLYDINIMEAVYEHPERFAEMLRPWQEYLARVTPLGVFQRQLQHWQGFRRWQQDNRGHEVCEDAEGFAAYISSAKERIEQDALHNSRAARLAQIEANPSCLRSGWLAQRTQREKERRVIREAGCLGFHDYVQAVHKSLKRHGCNHTPDLDEIPQKQDRLSTWIEYLNYEYWWLDRLNTKMEQLRPEYNELWKALVVEASLKPHETEEYIRTTESGVECDRERTQARAAVEEAKSQAKRVYRSTQTDPSRLNIPQEERILKLKVASETLLSAKRHYKQAQDRAKLILSFVRKTFDYDKAVRDVARHRVLVEWVSSQTSLVEAEVHAMRTRTRLKRKLQVEQQPCTKKAKFMEPETEAVACRADFIASQCDQTDDGNQRESPELRSKGHGRGSSWRNRAMVAAISPASRRSARITSHKTRGLTASHDGCRRSPRIAERDGCRRSNVP
ncbi:uncharacterized protein B0I36DRAFT_243505 [Microdochium trichocladiopsis]|uniref:Uncharacterized protein n=1 Tax=Microdochium trichocladiopsis TaxID=1682393 RepID=A0A9P8Y647_9PEZI|nr:uncharacterized protein B0I36DRAFT_243505 [Microdochium trichocladiopsis]KAH7031031.1 hypothetical protein B0I36DRAFT_243505 [Microdochium trichocladiopsis]